MGQLYISGVCKKEQI